MNINYEYYRVFYYAAKFGSITQAADFLRYNQPNVTRTIKLLEKELGCILFYRSNRGVTLTQQGKRLYEHAKIAVEHIEAAEKEIEDEAALESGIVFIGTTEIALRCVLLPILNEFRVQYPNVKINLTNYTTKQAIKALRDGFVDFSVVTTPYADAEGLAVHSLKAVQETAICGDYYKELHSGIYSFRQLSDYPMIAMEKGSNTYALYRDFFANQSLIFSPMLEAATADQIIPMVRNNLGIGFVAEDMAAEEPNGIYTIQTDIPLPKRMITLMRRKHASFSGASEKLWDLIAGKENI